MDSVTIRNIPEEAHTVFHEEDELECMLADAKQSPSTVVLVEMLAAFGRKYGPIESLPRQ